MSKLHFEQVIKEHQESLYRICLAYTSDVSDADDLMQEVLINIWKALPGFKGEAKLFTYLYRITVNTAISYQRKQKVTYTPLGDMPISQDHTDRKEKEVMERQYEKLLVAISTLPSRQRLIISLSLEGLSYAEIAEVTGSTVNYVGVNINRIKKRLTKELSQ